MRPRSVLAIATAASISLGSGCGGEDGGENTTGIADACNPLGGSSCLLPWPSAAYLADADTATGVKLALPVEAMPVNNDDIPVDPAAYNRFDGFAPSGALLAMFPGGVSIEGLPAHTDPGVSLTADSPTVVLDMETGERVLHFAEVDANVTSLDEQALIIRPLVRLRGSTRYAVAIRDTARSASGGALPVPAGFQAILDAASAGSAAGAADAFGHPLMARVAPRYDAIFEALEQAGVARGELVLAWDFVTASDEFLTADLRAMRDQAIPLIGEDGANLTFTATERAGDPALTLRALVGTHQSPSFLTNGALRDSVLSRGTGDLPAVTGMMDANYAMVIPRCAETAQLPIPVVVFGHGLFGSGADYLDDDLLQTIANQQCVVVVGGDFIGLSMPDLPTVAFAANDLNLVPQLTEKLPQSIINFIALEQIVRGPMRDDPITHVNGQPVIDPDRVFYLGGSLGGIMGNVFMSYDPNITLGAMGVPGGAWSVLFERSFAWLALRAVAMGSYDDFSEYQPLVSLLAMRFEPYDPITTAHLVLTGDPLLGVPPKQILMYEAIGDSLVTNLSTEMVARTMGLAITGPSVAVPFGFEETTDTLSSGFTIYDEHRTPEPPDTNTPPEDDNGTHSGVNENPAVLRQVERFLFTGEIVHTCEVGGAPAPCDCATGACD